MRDTITLAAALDNGLKEILETDPGEPGPWQGGWASKARQTKVPVLQPLNSWPRGSRERKGISL